MLKKVPTRAADLDKKQTSGKGAPIRAASPNKKVESHRQNWMNTVDPWSVQWIKTMADRTTENRTLKYLKTFVHQTQIAEVTPDLVQRIRQLSPEEVHFSIRELQNKPKFVQRKRSTNSLETRGTIVMTNGSKLPIVVLVDSGCSRSSLDESFVQENDIATYNLPTAIPVYNADGTPNSNGLISKFVTIELVIGEHSERLTLAVTKLSTHSIFLGFDWLKEHNPIIDWKQQKIEFTCVDNHLPGLIPVEDEEKEIGHDKEEERLF